ncbi:MAG: GNAT family N-acetyltransferase [Steroidobacter sp.]
MRESLERIGRFDAARARERFSNSFSPEHTRYIVMNNERLGFLVTRPHTDFLLLDLYIKQGWQNKGIGATVLAHVFSMAEKLQLPVRVGALRDSDSNRFYLRHGFSLVERTEFDNYYIRPLNAGET